MKKFILLLTAVVLSVSCFKVDPTWNAIEKLNELTTVKTELANLAVDIVHKFTFDETIILAWRQLVNLLHLSSKEVDALDKFFDYIEYTWKLENKVKNRSTFVPDSRYSTFRMFYEAEDALTDKQKAKGYKLVLDVVTKIGDCKDRINSAVGKEDVTKAMEKVAEKKEELKKYMSLIGMGNTTGPSSSVVAEADREPSGKVKELFKKMSEAAKDVMNAIDRKKIQDKLLDEIMDGLDKVDDITKDLVGDLNELCYMPK